MSVLGSETLTILYRNGFDEITIKPEETVLSKCFFGFGMNRYSFVASLKTM